MMASSSTSAELGPASTLSSALPLDIRPLDLPRRIGESSYRSPVSTQGRGRERQLPLEGEFARGEQSPHCSPIPPPRARTHRPWAGLARIQHTPFIPKINMTMQCATSAVLSGTNAMRLLSQATRREDTRPSPCLPLDCARRDAMPGIRAHGRDETRPLVGTHFHPTIACPFAITPFDHCHCWADLNLPAAFPTGGLAPTDTPRLRPAQVLASCPPGTAHMVNPHLAITTHRMKSRILPQGAT
jgi:hypothetical protein